MRVWLDPGKLAARGLTAGDVVRGTRRSQPAGRSAGRSTSRRPPSPGAFQLPVQTLGRLRRCRAVRRTSWCGADHGTGCVRVRDVARVELGSQDYTVNAYLNGKATATAIVIYQRPGSNALDDRRPL